MAINLSDEKIIKALRWYADKAVQFDMFEPACRIVSYIEENFSDEAVPRPEDQIEYQEIMKRARFAAIPSLDEGEIIELLRENFADALDFPDYDLWRKLKTKLIAMPRFEDRDALKKKIREEIVLNEQTMTEQGVELDGVKERGTVKNWLTDYYRTLGTGKVENIKLTQYLTNGPSTKNLSDKDRRRLDYLLKFFEKLKISSLDLDGVEETTIFKVDGEIDIYEEGRTERISRDDRETVKKVRGLEAPSSLEADLEAKYRGDEAMAGKIEATAEKISGASGGDFKKMAGDLLAAIPGTGRAADKIKIAAILKVMAEGGGLAKLPEEKEFGKMLAAHFKEKNRKADFDGFKLNSKNPEYLAALVRHILVDRAGMSEDESGRIGMQLFNSLFKNTKDAKYQGLVYFDMEDREFKWA